MSDDIATIRDADGRVWTGRITAISGTGIGEGLLGLLTGGISLMIPGNGTITVEVNGVEHTGSPIDDD